jgi:hypothetical protein
MRRISSKGSLWAAVLLFAVAGNLQAQVYIINDNLDSYPSGTATAGYTFGDVTNASHMYLSGAGVGGSTAAVIQSDFTPPGVGYGGVAYQYQVGNTGGINTSGNLSDYTLSFDAEVNKSGGGFGLTVQSWASPYFVETFTSSSSASDYGIATSGVFQHFSVNLGTLNAGVVMTGQTLQIAWQMDEYMYGGPGTGDQLVIDNVQLTMVPEPSTFALAALGGLGSFAVLRRRRV